MKGRFLKKLKSIPTITTLKQGFIFQFNPSEKFSNQNFQNPPVCKEEEQRNTHLQELLPCRVAISELSIKDEETESPFHVSNKENLTPSEIPLLSDSGSDSFRSLSSSEADVMSISISRANSFQLDPSDTELELNSGSLFDQSCIMEDTSTEKSEDFKCPPGGSHSVVLYTTSLRGIRKTFKDCNTIRFLLASFQVVFYERDVSMDLELREELWRIMGGRVVPPRLFIKGRYIGGADEVVGLHEKGELKRLLQGIPLDQSIHPCHQCGGVRFLLCAHCDGSRKVYTDEGNDELFSRCHECNENGLIKCTICS